MMIVSGPPVLIDALAARLAADHADVSVHRPSPPRLDVESDDPAIAALVERPLRIRPD
jgi:hypothetical protein